MYAIEKTISLGKVMYRRFFGQTCFLMYVYFSVDKFSTFPIFIGPIAITDSPNSRISVFCSGGDNGEACGV